MFSDPLVLLIGASLVATVSGFLAGLVPYPFGILMLTILLVARILYLRQK